MQDIFGPRSTALIPHGYMLYSISAIDLRLVGSHYTFTKLLINNLNYWFKILWLKSTTAARS